MAKADYSSASDSGYQLNKLIFQASTTGLTQTLLPEATPSLIDRGAALRVELASGDLASAELSEVLNGANVAVIGDGSAANWEVFQFTDAILVSQGVYDISGRIRGQAGTDALASTEWPAGSRFVLLDGAAEQINLSLSARGLARHYRIGPATRAFDDPSYDYYYQAFDGIGLRPLAPVHLRSETEPNGDINLNWIRRTRIDGDNWQSLDVPLGEDDETYLVQVIDGGSVVRDLNVSQPSWTYTAAAQTSDGVSGSFTVQIAQMSARFGSGLFRRITVND